MSSGEDSIQAPSGERNQRGVEKASRKHSAKETG